MARGAVVDASRNLEEEIRIMFDSTREMFEAAWEGFRRRDKESLNRAERIGREIHQKEKELTQSIMAKLSREEESIKQIEGVVFLPAHLERIGDDIELLIRGTRKIIEDGTCFSERAIKEINTLFNKAIELLQCVRDVLKTRNKVLVKYIRDEGKNFQEMINEYSLAHQERLIEGTCMSKASSVYLAILDYLAEIERHIRQMSDKIVV